MTLSFTQVKEWYPIELAGSAVSALNIFLFLGASMATTVSAFMIGSDYSHESFRTLWTAMAVLAGASTLCIYLSREKGREQSGTFHNR